MFEHPNNCSIKRLTMLNCCTPGFLRTIFFSFVYAQRGVKSLQPHCEISVFCQLPLLQNVFSAISPFVKLSVRQNVFRQNVCIPLSTGNKELYIVFQNIFIIATDQYVQVVKIRLDVKNLYYLHSNTSKPV